MNKSLRWKMILYFIASIFLAVAGVLVLLLIALSLATVSGFFSSVLNYLELSLGEIPVMILTGCVLFIFFFFTLSKGSIRYLEEISGTLGKIAGGDFSIQIPKRSDDELGELAEDINQMTRQLKQSIEEERNAERTKNELITSVSHDLRTPLTSILGYLDLIDSDQYKDEVELRYYVNIAHHKSQRLKKMIDDLFEFTRMSYGGMKAKPELIDLGELLGQLAEESVPLFREAGMEYRLSVPREKITVLADGDLLARVFDNLVSNGIRYGKTGKYIDLELVKDGHWAVVRVTNYGAPIPQEDLPHLFERFYRVEKSRSGETGGTGLGLAIAKSIMDLHKGQIRAYSETGRTIFEVCLKISSRANTHTDRKGDQR
ncbi:MAG: HAMP domain-containing sensor histidine kinase [Syntrophaceticus sp.]|nr:HAMP domain-containing sensor histidine kinase [Syntrophaceticus sp.]MDD3314537.1 HAMP domain-containing sensor histidine kinase [Syntrophaceticus sp.]MDD4782349.1 HAMP domain-containing sensor histidine kinase [Syntrophaceticus sp.]